MINSNYIFSAPIAVLTTGLKVANFSSPHAFIFSDGTILPACDESRSRSLSLQSSEVLTKRNGWQDVDISFTLDFLCLAELSKYQDFNGVVIVPRLVLDAIKYHNQNDSIKINENNFRTCRLFDRITKVVCIDKFCK